MKKVTYRKFLKKDFQKLVSPVRLSVSLRTQFQTIRKIKTFNWKLQKRTDAAKSLANVDHRSLIFQNLT